MGSSVVTTVSMKLQSTRLIRALIADCAHDADKHAINLLIIKQNLLSDVGRKHVISQSADAKSKLKKCFAGVKSS